MLTDIRTSEMTGPRTTGDGARGAPQPPRLAVLVVPAHARRTRALRHRLCARYGIDQFQHIALTPSAWRTAVAGPADSPEVERLRARLALARLCGAGLVVVVGCGAASSAEGPPHSWADVQRLAHRVQSWARPAEVIGVWLGNGAAGSVRPSDQGVEDDDGPYSDYWMAERTWEDDGGRIHTAPRHAGGRNALGGEGGHVVREGDPSQRAHPGTPKKRRARHLERGDVSRFRPGLAGAARILTSSG